MTDLSRADTARPSRHADPHRTDPHRAAAFGALARRALHEAGYSMRAAARAINYDVAYLSRVLNGKQPSSPRLAAALDRLLATGGVLGEALRRDRPEKPDAPRPAPDPRFGGGELLDAAVRVWRARLEQGLVPQEARPEMLGGRR